MAETVTTNVGAASKTAFGTVKIGDGIAVANGVISAAAAVTDQHINDLINARLKTVLATATVGADGTMTFSV